MKEIIEKYCTGKCPNYELHVNTKINFGTITTTFNIQLSKENDVTIRISEQFHPYVHTFYSPEKLEMFFQSLL